MLGAWTVLRRYAEFADLRDELIELGLIWATVYDCYIDYGGVTVSGQPDDSGHLPLVVVYSCHIDYG